MSGKIAKTTALLLAFCISGSCLVCADLPIVSASGAAINFTVPVKISYENASEAQAAAADRAARREARTREIEEIVRFSGGDEVTFEAQWDETAAPTETGYAVEMSGDFAVRGSEEVITENADAVFSMLHQNGGQLSSYIVSSEEGETDYLSDERAFATMRDEIYGFHYLGETFTDQGDDNFAVFCNEETAETVVARPFGLQQPRSAIEIRFDMTEEEFEKAKPNLQSIIEDIFPDWICWRLEPLIKVRRGMYCIIEDYLQTPQMYDYAARFYAALSRQRYRFEYFRFYPEYSYVNSAAVFGQNEDDYGEYWSVAYSVTTEQADAMVPYLQDYDAAHDLWLRIWRDNGHTQIPPLPRDPENPDTNPIVGDSESVKSELSMRIYDTESVRDVITLLDDVYEDLGIKPFIIYTGVHQNGERLHTDFTEIEKTYRDTMREDIAAMTEKYKVETHIAQGERLVLRFEEHDLSRLVESVGLKTIAKNPDQIASALSEALSLGSNASLQANEDRTFSVLFPFGTVDTQTETARLLAYLLDACPCAYEVIWEEGAQLYYDIPGAYETKADTVIRQFQTLNSARYTPMRAGDYRKDKVGNWENGQTHGLVIETGHLAALKLSQIAGENVVWYESAPAQNPEGGIALYPADEPEKYVLACETVEQVAAAYLNRDIDQIVGFAYEKETAPVMFEKETSHIVVSPKRLGELPASVFDGDPRFQAVLTDREYRTTHPGEEIYSQSDSLHLIPREAYFTESGTNGLNWFNLLSMCEDVEDMPGVGQAFVTGILDRTQLQTATDTVICLGSGDLNQDNLITLADGVLLSRVKAENDTPTLSKRGIEESDLDGDGICGFMDIRKMLDWLS